jgi:hypothetical protein
LESETILRDELNEPLGFGPNARKLAARRGAGAFAAGAAFIAAAALSSQMAFLVGSAPRGKTVVAVAQQATRAPTTAIVPLRGAGETEAAPHAQIAGDRAGADESAAHVARPDHASRPSGTQPLIIDVRQALAGRRGGAEAQLQP